MALPPNVLLFPGATPPVVPQALPNPTMRAYVGHVARRELVDAADCLCAMVGLTEDRAYHYTLHFSGQYRKNPERSSGQIMRLALEAHEGRKDRVLALLRDCFGVVGREATSVMLPLQALSPTA
ncbi:MAG: hypothetical protein ACI9MC_001020 [Kiritimatiellia bacterium]|jgi:hypothetical protein